VQPAKAATESATAMMENLTLPVAHHAATARNRDLFGYTPRFDRGARNR